MIDEVRHSTIQQNLKRLYMNNYIDRPASTRACGTSTTTTAARSGGSSRRLHHRRCDHRGQHLSDHRGRDGVHQHAVRGHAGRGRRQRRLLLPTVFHSVQSDESRHISNGYATLLMALSDEGNHQLLERDLRYAWWNNHRVVDARSARSSSTAPRTAARSASPTRRCGAAGSTTILPQLPGAAGEVRAGHPARPDRGSLNQIWNKGYVHEVAQFFATGWLANYWRSTR